MVAEKEKTKKDNGRVYTMNHILFLRAAKTAINSE
jgi:hypothetical protein